MPQTKTSPITPRRAFWINAASLVISWAGWQVMIIGCTYMGSDWTEMAYLTLFGAVLIAYTLRLRLRLRMTDSLPSREPTQLFYSAALVVLPVVTLLLRRNVLGGKFYGAPLQLIYLSGLVSLGYFIYILLMLMLDVEQYPRAEPESWSRRFMRTLRKWRKGRSE